MVDAVLSVANANNQWSALQAQKQMDFQERMSSSAHQREIADLKAAGLNPVLSARLGGASTPSGAMGDTDTSVTSAIIDAISAGARAGAYGAASGSAAGQVADDGNIYEWLRVAANALPYRYRKSANGVIDILEGNNALANLPDGARVKAPAGAYTAANSSSAKQNGYVFSQKPGFWNWKSPSKWISDGKPNYNSKDSVWRQRNH